MQSTLVVLSCLVAGALCGVVYPNAYGAYGAHPFGVNYLGNGVLYNNGYYGGVGAHPVALAKNQYAGPFAYNNGFGLVNGLGAPVYGNVYNNAPFGLYGAKAAPLFNNKAGLVAPVGVVNAAPLAGFAKNSFFGKTVPAVNVLGAKTVLGAPAVALGKVASAPLVGTIGKVAATPLVNNLGFGKAPFGKLGFG